MPGQSKWRAGSFHHSTSSLGEKQRRAALDEMKGEAVRERAKEREKGITYLNPNEPGKRDRRKTLQREKAEGGGLKGNLVDATVQLQ